MRKQIPAVVDRQNRVWRANHCSPGKLSCRKYSLNCRAHASGMNFQRGLKKGVIVAVVYLEISGQNY